jgi:hypothetical protein
MRYLLVILLAIGCNKADYGHKCKWDMCPYKGVTADIASQSVSAYVGETGTDAYCLDMLHLQHPDYEYEQLEDLLFNNRK